MGYWLTQLANIFETAISAVGAHLSVVVCNIFFLGMAVMMSLGPYAMVILQKKGLSLPIALSLTFLIVLAASLIFVAAYLKLSAESFTVFSLASVLAFDALLKSWDNVTGGVLGIAGITRPGIIPTLSALVIMECMFAVVVLTGEYVILKTWFGRALLAMKENKYVVESFGYSTKKLGSALIVIVSLTSAFSGILFIWRIRFIDPSFGGLIFLIQVLTIAIIAAKPKIRWLILSTLIIVLLPEVFRFFALPPTIIGHLRNLLYALSLIVIVKSVSGSLLPQKRFI